MTTATSASSFGSRRALAFLPWIAGVIAIAVYLFLPASHATTVSLDDSNYTSYAYFTSHGFHYGPQVVPVVGPLGFVLYGFVYAGELFWQRLTLDLLLKAGLAVLLLGFFHRSPSRLYRWCWLAAMLAMLPLIGDASFDFAILLAGLLLVLEVENHDSPWRRYAAAALIAVLALFKGTEFALALSSVGLFSLTALLTRRFAVLAKTLAVFVGAFLVCWICAWQNPVNIPSYFRGIVELSAGYNDAMSLQEPEATFRAGFSVIVLLELAIAGAIVLHARRRALVASLVLVGGFSFIIWKHGFVRADGHVLIFFWYACAIAATIVLLTNGQPLPARAIRWHALRTFVWAAAGLAFYDGAYATGGEAVARIRWEMSQLPHTFFVRAHYLLHAGAEKQRLETELTERRDRYALRHVTEIVGRHRIDFFGSEHGFLPLNGLKYRPRPMGGGSFSVYTPYLEQINERFIDDAKLRPEFLLLNLWTLDQRLLTQDDARSLLAILRGYAPIETEQGLLLLQGHPVTPNPPETLLAERSFALGETVDVPQPKPGQLVLASFDVPHSLAGRLRSFLYKSPALQIAVDHDGAPTQTRRFIAGMVRLPILFSPWIETNQDFLSLYGGTTDAAVRGFRITSETPRFFAPKLTVRFYSVPAPAPIDRIALAQLQQRLRFPVADTVPLQMKNPAMPLRNFDGYLVQMLEPPGEIVFAARGDERVLTFDFGIDPEAFERGNTDGVEFSVEVLQGGTIRQPLFTQLLRPKTVVADRGRHTARIVLPPLTPHSTIALRTGPGLAGDGAWDWAYLSKIRFERGPYRTEQFPGFRVAPVLVDDSSPGVLPSEYGDVFMLNAPSRLEFALRGGETLFTYSGGLLPGAYSNTGHSDGVRFYVELITPDGTTTLLQQRRVNPRDNPADRGALPNEVRLPAHAPGARLRLRTDAGPAGDGSWDWTFLNAADIR